MTNDAAERLRGMAADYDKASRANFLDLLDQALAAERRATVERIRERYAMHGDTYFVEWLDSEAERP